MKFGKLNSWALATLMVIALPFAMTSCGDDDAPAPQPSKTASVRVNYSADLDDTWFQFYDIKVTYTTPGGVATTEQIGTDWDHTITLPYEEMPQNVVFKVMAHPKESHPEVVDGTTYPIGHAFNLRLTSLAEDGTTTNDINYSNPTNSTASTGGDAFRNALLREHTLCDKTYSATK